MDVIQSQKGSRSKDYWDEETKHEIHAKINLCHSIKEVVDPWVSKLKSTLGSSDGLLAQLDWDVDH